MKARTIVMVALLVAMVASPLLAKGGQEEAEGAEEKIVLRFAESNAAKDMIVVAAEKFAESIKEKTDGRIVVEVYPSSQLGGNKEVLQSLQMGAIDLTRVKPGHLYDLGVKNVQVYSLPFIFEDINHARTVLRSELGNDVLENIKDEGAKVVGVGYYANAPRNFFFTDKPVTTIDDMKGLKLRTMPGEIYVDMVESFGASPTPMAFSELYSALQTGVVDGAENPVKGYYAQKFYEVCKHYTYTRHSADPSIVVMSEMTWNTLSDADRNIIKESLVEASKWFDDQMDVIVEEYIEELKNDYGVKFYEVEDPEKWQQAAQKLYDKYGKGFEEEIEQIQSMR